MRSRFLEIANAAGSLFFGTHTATRREPARRPAPRHQLWGWLWEHPALFCEKRQSL